MDDFTKTCEFPQLPVGTNNAYFHRNNRRILKPEVKAWREEIAWSFKGRKLDAKGRYGIEVLIEMVDNRRRDVDSGIKFILDALSGIIWKDDRQVSEVHMFKEHKCPENKTVISVYQL